MTKAILQLPVLLIGISAGYAQNVHMPQIQEMNIWYNPALKTTRVPQAYACFSNVTYRGIASYSGRAISIDLPLIPPDADRTDVTSYGNITAGIDANSSKDGYMASSSAMLAFSYAMPLNGNETYLAAGFSGNYNFSRIKPYFYNYYPEQFDKQGAIGSALAADPYQTGDNYGYLTVTTGVSVFHNGQNTQWYAGISSHNFNHPYTEWNHIERLASNTGIQAAFTTYITDASAIGVYANLSWQGKDPEHYAGVFYTRNLDDSANYKITGGMGFSVGDALVPNLRATLKRAHVSFYYDISLPNSLYRDYSRSAYTCSLSYDL